MIYKDSTIDFYKILNEASTTLTETQDAVVLLKDDLSEKINLIQIKLEYEHYLNQLNNSNVYKSYTYSKLLCQDHELTGEFERYGSCIHPATITEPENIFNIITHNQIAFFREDVLVKINGIHEKYNNNILKHDLISDKQIFNRTYDNKLVTLEISIDNSNPLGKTLFNTIEFDPFLEGSFSIKQLKILPKNTIDNEEIIIGPIKNITKERYILDKKIDFEKITMDIEINYSIHNNGDIQYPLILNHIYFYNTNYKNKCNVQTRFECNKNISSIKDATSIKTQEGEESISLTDKEIHLYADYTNGKYDLEIHPSYENKKYEIAKNTKEVFLAMDLEIKAYKLISLDISLK